MRHLLSMLAGGALVAFGAFYVGPLVSQPSSPGAINGCVVLATPVSSTNLQSIPFTCDTSGRLRTTTGGPGT